MYDIEAPHTYPTELTLVRKILLFFSTEQELGCQPPQVFPIIIDIQVMYNNCTDLLIL